jgi:PAS domain S-box-containing protein
MTPEQFLVWAALFPESLLLITVRGTILAANGPAGAFAGRRAPTLAGSRLFDLVTTPPAQVTAYLQACARTRAMLPGALTFCTPDGRENACQTEGALIQARTAATEAVLLLRCRPRPQAMQPFDRLNQRFQALSKTYRQLQQSHVRLQEQREWFEQTLISIGDAVITTDPQGRVTLMNAVAAALTGWRKQEARGQDISHIFHIVDMATGQVVENPVHRVLREGRMVGLANHTLLIARDSTSRPIDDSGAPIYAPDGRLLGVVLVFRDVTERVEAEQVMQQVQADLERRVAERTAALEQEMAERQRLEREAQRVQHFALLGRLAAGVSHEIRNPLAAVFLHVDVLAEELENPSPDSAAEVDLALAEIKEHLARLDDLVQDYLSLVRVGAIERLPQDLGALLLGWAAEWRELVAADGVNLQCKGLASLGQIMCHLSTLRRAILNLIQNGVEAMPAGGTLTLTGQSMATHIQLEVQDEGNGIPPNALSQIFEPLYTTKPGGTGLGLYIVQEIIAAHGGQVSVRSAVGQGTVFTITLPRQAEDFD